VIVAVFADAHAHADALEAVIAAAQEHGVDELWSLGDMVGRGPDPEHVVARTRECCRVALLGNHDYDALRATEPPRFVRSFALARERLDDDAIAWMRSRRPAAKRGDVQCWHASPRNPVHEYVGATNAAACLEKQRAPLGLIGHTHVAAAWHEHTRRVRITPGEPLDISQGKWLLNPGAVGAPASSRLGWWAGLDAQAAACWLLLDLDAQTATWRAAPFDPAPAHARVRELGLEDG
jgi:predicted phosphodiesterase